MTDDWGTDAGWGAATDRLVTISKLIMIFYRSKKEKCLGRF